VERRFVLFLVLAFLILAANVLVNQFLFPPRQQAVVQAKKDEAKDDKAKPKKEADRLKPAADEPDDDSADEAPDDEKSAAVDPKAETSDGEMPDGETADNSAGQKPGDGESAGDAGVAAQKPASDPAANAQLAAAKIPTQRISLGSYDPAAGYRLLVTLTNTGAAVERVELNSPKYRELEDRSGYIGHLAPSNVPHAGGCIIQVVGRGTPAALAGLQAGDIITKLNGKAIATAADFEAALKDTEAGQKVGLVGEREGQPLNLEVELERRPLEIIRPEFDTKPLDVVSAEHDPLSMLLTIEQAGRRRVEKDKEEIKGLDLRTGNWELVRADEEQAVFRRQVPKLGLEVTKHYRLAKTAAGQNDPDAPDYHLLLNVQIRNTSTKPLEVAYRLDGPTGLPLEGAWYATKISREWGASGMRDVIGRFEGRKPAQESCNQIADDKAKHWSESEGPLDFIAVDTQYFASAVLPRRPAPGDVWLADIRAIRVGAVPAEKADKKLTDVSFRMTSVPIELEPDGSLDHEYQIFAGPKNPALLDQYVDGDANLGELIYYGWFGWVAKPMLALLHFFYRLVHNYGVAIIMLTVLVRGCMFPLSRKQAMSAQKMQELRPEIARINEKFKTPEQRTKAQQDLFRKHNYNPFGGCLLVFVQLPVFVGLYRSLMVDVELRQAPLISESIRWASNLAAPDMFWDWSAMMPNFVIGYLGPYLNLFPLATIGLFIWQQKMFMPPPADEQAAMQQKIMSYMMIFMGVMFFKVACGLCLYFIASSLWGIAERKMLPKTATPGQGGGTDGKAVVPTRGNGGNGAPGGKQRQRGRK
jgi:YidC/Oxa1 family membrane protein insertase